MSALDNLARQVSNIVKVQQDAEKRYEEAKKLTNTTAKVCTYLGNGMILVDGEVVAASCCSDVPLVKGYSVFCLPTKNGDWVIVGSGV